MTTVYRHPHIPRRRPRQGHRRGAICRRVQRRRPRLWQRRHLDHRQGPHRAHRRERGARRRRRARRAHPREPAADGRHRQGLQRRCGAGGGSPFRPLYDDKIKFNGQPIALVLAEDWETARFAASLVRVEYETEAHATDLHARRDEAFVVEKPEKPRGDADEGLCRRRRCATRPNISSRSSITIRWSCLPRRWSGTAAASSRSTTRRRACRTCSATCAACSA